MNSALTLLRTTLRVPLSSFDMFRSLYERHPKWINYYLLNAFVVTALIVGKGAENITSKQGRVARYELRRRARRLFIPYSLMGYKWRFLFKSSE